MNSRDIDFDKCKWYAGGCIIEQGTENYRYFLELLIKNRHIETLQEIRDRGYPEIHLILNAASYLRYKADNEDRKVFGLPTNNYISDSIKKLTD
ncbi:MULTISPECIES: hypothetical protein [Sphingobacterium]|uniref:hypothetical protein n=1 Tax=Sphingobacterium TaxID=28453 RepID=UPI000E80F1E4|nr:MULTISPECIES: hypothetical protein [Sphingobacterium]HAF34561.1 hypothetical protein [Sphingobacterium sp.]HAL53433.1 hypothetical protein [Sphingobacterium sp.]HAT92466.1 hypothetical protein [Sphingobacterium sp.]